MATATVQDVEALPAVLTMRQVQNILGICRPKVYDLAHTKGFPVVKLGRSFRVPRDSFVRWLKEQAESQEEGGR
jgi:excisionase family DNA binding protein